MERYEVVQRCLDLYSSPKYLEIGVNQGHTFHLVNAAKKVGVDPEYLFPLDEAKVNFPNNIYMQMTSDDYFRNHLNKEDKFDLIFVDGLHRFEQVLKDFLNSLEMLSENGLIIVDDVIPRDFASSVPDIPTMSALRSAQGSLDSTWMGDVYKLVFFISSFMTNISYATVKENHGQMICWRQTRALTDQTYDGVYNKNFASVVLEQEVFKLKNFEDIIAELPPRT